MILCRLVCLLLLPIFSLSGNELGKIHFPTSANSEAQVSFIEGVLWLHNFEFEKANSAFLKAERADPNFALSYWGEAMTYNQPVWNQQNLLMAKKSLEKLAPTAQGRVEKAKTAKEKGFIRAVNLLFGDDNDKEKRDIAYSNAMRDLYYQFPNDNEIALFYALSLLGLNEEGQDFTLNMEAAAIAEEVTLENPKNPGALHYALHAYDDPIHAPLGLRAARSYPNIAGDASHALHMPSHIYLALGMWDSVVTSNIAAWNVGKKNNPHHIPENYNENDLHALQWLSYGYLQEGKFSESYHLVKIMQTIAEATNTPLAKFHYGIMRSDYFVNSKNWEADLPALAMQDIEPLSRSSDLYATAMIELNTDQKQKKIASYLSEMDEISNLKPKSLEEKNKNPYTAPSTNGLQVAKILTLELRAQIETKQGNLKKGIQILEEALLLADQLPRYSTLPAPVKPVHELLAEFLMQDQQYVDAYKQYKIQLSLTHNRFLSNEGLKKTEAEMHSQGISPPKERDPYFNKFMAVSVRED